MIIHPLGGSHSATAYEKLISVSTSLTPIQRAVTYRSIVDLPFVHEFILDPDEIRDISGVARLGDLTAKNVAVVGSLGALAHTTAEDFYDGDEASILLGDILRLAVKTRQDLWLAAIPKTDVARVQEILGADLVHPIGPPSATAARLLAHRNGHDDQHGLDADEIRTAVPVAISPNRLVEEWAKGTPRQQALLGRMMEGTDTLMMRRSNLQALRSVGTRLVDRSKILRCLVNPKVLAYLVVIIYSSLRALPVMFVKGFHGKIWALWTIDIVTAIPYTWGVVEMFAGRTLTRRILGMIVTFVTFTSPYVYFWMHGKGYPLWVVVVIVLMIGSAVVIEYARWLRDRAVRAVLSRQPIDLTRHRR